MSGVGQVTAVTRTLLALGLTAIYAVCFVAIKAGLAFAPPLLFGGLRTLIGGLALLALAIALGQPPVPARREWGAVLVLALVGTTVAFGAMFLSVGRTGAGIASVLGNMQPLIVVVLAAMFLSERLTRGKLSALALGLVGVALISAPELVAPQAGGMAGGALALSASGGVALSSVIVKRIGAQLDLLAVTAWQLLLGSLPLLAGAALVERDAGVVWNSQFVGLLLLLAVVGTALASALWYWLVQRDDVGRLTMFLFLVPVLGLGLAAVVFGEAVSPLEGTGVLLTLAGVGVVTWESWQRPAAPQVALRAGGLGSQRPS